LLFLPATGVAAVAIVFSIHILFLIHRKIITQSMVCSQYNKKKIAKNQKSPEESLSFSMTLLD